MTYPQTADGGDSLQIWKGAANVMKKQFWMLTRGGPTAWGLGIW